VNFFFIYLFFYSFFAYTAVGLNPRLPINPNIINSNSILNNNPHLYRPGVSSQQISQLTITAGQNEILALKDKEDFQEIKPSDFNFNENSLKFFSSQQISWITEAQFARLDTSKLRSFNVEQLKELSPDQKALFIQHAGSKLPPDLLAQINSTPRIPVVTGAPASVGVTPPSAVAAPPPREPSVGTIAANVAAAPAVGKPFAVTDSSSPVPASNQPLVASDYDPESCSWAPDMPRRIVVGPSCGRTRNRTCVAYVVCNRKSKADLKFVRMSSCSANYCNQNSIEGAKGCTKDKSHHSVKPSNEDSDIVSEKVRDILSGASSR
jgi:hypothetical protein